jgi:hypothetical protein
MSASPSFLAKIHDPFSVITALEHGVTFPESLENRLKKYRDDILLFKKLVEQAESSACLLEEIRNPKKYSDNRMSLLKLFRRCVSLACDTEATKKIKKTPTASIVQNLGHTFKSIEILKSQFKALSEPMITALAALMGENDDRGQLGYALTDAFFTWFEINMIDFTISGPRGAGKDIELSSILKDFEEDCPCDFIIQEKETENVCAIGFARYDSSRGGSQSDDRTGGNANKVDKVRRYFEKTGKALKLIFLADGPGLVHKDTWAEACKLDGAWNERVRVVTLRMATDRILKDWLLS